MSLKKVSIKVVQNHTVIYKNERQSYPKNHTVERWAVENLIAMVHCYESYEKLWIHNIDAICTSITMRWKCFTEWCAREKKLYNYITSFTSIVLKMIMIPLVFLFLCLCVRTRHLKFLRNKVISIRFFKYYLSLLKNVDL